jgi:hypothetical protein
MNLLKKLIILSFLISIVGCSSINKFSRINILEYERNGYTVNLNSTSITFNFIYLNNTNIKSIKKVKSTKTIFIESKTPPKFYTIEDLKRSKKIASPLKFISINGLSQDSLEILKIKFEVESIKYVRLLTQADYKGPEFDSLPSVKRAVGTGILMIETN